MSLRFFLIAFFVFISNEIKAQNEANVWIVGEDFGIDFNFKRFEVFDRTTFLEGEYRINGSSASICDANTGDLLFYTEGRNVWNRNFQIMPNGTDIIGSTRFGANQSALVLPYPGKKDWYYLFTARSFKDSIVFLGGENFEIVPTGLYYSIVDMSLDTGKGDVVASSKNLLLHKENTNLITAVPKPNSNSYWLITCEYVESRLAIYPVTADGIGTPAYSNLGYIYGDDGFSGCIKPSPDGTKIVFLPGSETRASTNTERDILLPVELYNFDPISGTLFNRREIGRYPNLVSASFSPDNTKLYISHYNESDAPNYSDFPPLLQFDLAAGSLQDIIASETAIEWDTDPRIFVPIPSYTLQLAPDGRLYNAGYTYISIPEKNQKQRVIFYLDKPNLKGNAALAGFRFLDSPNNTVPDRVVGYTPDFLFPNFTQHYFNNITPVDNFIESGECDSAKFMIGPNPAADFIHIIASNESCLLPANVRAYNALGQLLDEATIVDPNTTHFDFRNYTAGIYLLVIENIEKVFTFKLIKK